MKHGPWLDLIKGSFNYAQLQTLDREAPEKLEVPTGNQIALTYEIGRPPILAVRVQEVFGWMETPRIAGGRVKVHVVEAGPTIDLRITDTGIGIAKEDLPVALAAFGQVDSSLARKHEGTGLGLPLSKALVEMHGGTLQIDSEVGVGTTVTVKLPVGRVVSRAASAAA